MRYVLKYYGLLKDITLLDEEEIELPATTSQELKKALELQYPDFKSVQYSIAVNRQLITASIALNTNDEIALLPPFAGG